MPLHLSSFLASGAVWGRDPVTNQARATKRDWPGSSEWLSETGIAIAWRTGIPDPTSSFRFEYTFPLGADDRSSGYSLVYQQPLHLLRIR
jgi:outer membrane protein assembly factor BamA